MKWVKKTILILWASALILIGMYYAINWDILEQQRVEERVTENIDVQTDVLNVLVTGFSEKAEIDITATPFLYRIYTNGELVKWSDDKALPSYSLLRQQDSLYFLEHVSGKYVVQKKAIEQEGEITEFFSVIRLEENFQILNNFLRDIVNPRIFAQAPKLVAKTTDFPIEYDGQVIFGIVPSGSAKATLLAVSIWLLLLSLPLTIGYVLLSRREQLQNGWYLVLTIFGLITFRLILFWANFPGRWLNSPIFDELVYTSSLASLTMGDTLISFAFLVLIIGIVSGRMKTCSPVSTKWKRVVGLFLAIFLIYL
ncbi:MAG: hypothetical protein GY816_01260, partial [Cytophagales bacterium]|nr:hypothetical protein [Cytophagales bacterium]